LERLGNLPCIKRLQAGRKEGLRMGKQDDPNPPGGDKLPPKTVPVTAQPHGGETVRGAPSPNSYYLVVIMLGVLGVLALLLIVTPMWFPKDQYKDYLEYYKWAFSVLMGAFGAWIGAGAAYFFGKENLLESSTSTERAMQIQMKSFRRPPAFEQIKDMNLTSMNPSFLFDSQTEKHVVTENLTKSFKGYWFVPVRDKDTGVLKDIIHAKVFWDPGFMKPDTKLEALVTEMDKHADLKKLHGDSFFVTVAQDDKIADVYNLMLQRDAEVAIVVDQASRPLQCLSKSDLRNVIAVAKEPD
jgi:hypothetical protein